MFTVASEVAFSQTRGVEIEGQISKEITYKDIVNQIVDSLNRNAQNLFGSGIKNKKIFSTKSKNGRDSLSLYYELNGSKYNLSVESDMSIVPDSEKLQGVEIVSPILNNALDVQLFALAVQDLSFYLGLLPQKSTSGFHVHIKAPDMNIKNIIRLLGLFSKVEDVFYEVFEVDSQRVKFASKTKQLYEKIKNNDGLRLGSTLGMESDLELNVLTRHYGLNLLSLLRFQTFEFRLFNSTVLASEIMYIVEMSRRLVHMAYNEPELVDNFLNKESVKLDDISKLLKMSLKTFIDTRKNNKFLCEKLF